MTRSLCMIAGAAFLLWGQDEAGLKAPMIGRIFDSASGTIRAVQGIIGAATLTRVEPGARVFARGALAPGGAYGLVADGDSLLLQRFGYGVEEGTVATGFGAIDQIVFSPTGAAAAAYSGRARKIAVISGLPEAAVTVRDLWISEGECGALAVSDDAKVVAIACDGRLAVYDGDAPPLPLVLRGAATALAFSPAGRDLAVAVGSQRVITLIRDVTGSAEQTDVARESDGVVAPGAVRFSIDGKRILVADSRSIHTIPTDGGAPDKIECACRPDTLEAISADGVYRITADGAQPLWLLALSESGSRLVFVPPAPDAVPSEAGAEQ